MVMIAKDPVVALFGSDGMAGTAIDHVMQKSGFDVRRLNRSRFDIEKAPVTSLSIDGIDLVVNAAGVINRHLENRNSDVLMSRVNTEFPNELAAVCASRGTPLIHLSTDCVFDGKKGLYVEDDAPVAKDLYGASKAQGEPETAVVLRTSIVGPEAKNFYSLLCWFLSQSDECMGYVDQMWNGITTIQLGEVIVSLVRQALLDPGIHHVYADDLTKCELLDMFKVKFGKDIRIIPTESGNRRDMRLRTVNPAFLSAVNIAPTERQIEALVPLCNARGAWLNGI